MGEPFGFIPPPVLPFAPAAANGIVATGGLLGGVAAGAKAGAIFGPKGAAIGGLVGGLFIPLFFPPPAEAPGTDPGLDPGLNPAIPAPAPEPNPFPDYPYPPAPEGPGPQPGEQNYIWSFHLIWRIRSAWIQYCYLNYPTGDEPPVREYDDGWKGVEAAEVRYDGRTSTRGARCADFYGPEPPEITLFTILYRRAGETEWLTKEYRTGVNGVWDNKDYQYVLPGQQTMILNALTKDGEPQTIPDPFAPPAPEPQPRPLPIIPTPIAPPVTDPDAVPLPEPEVDPQPDPLTAPSPDNPTAPPITIPKAPPAPPQEVPDEKPAPSPLPYPTEPGVVPLPQPIPGVPPLTEPNPDPNIQPAPQPAPNPAPVPGPVPIPGPGTTPVTPTEPGVVPTPNTPGVPGPGPITTPTTPENPQQVDPGTGIVPQPTPLPVPTPPGHHFPVPGQPPVTEGGTRQDIASIAAEVGRIEQKVARLQNGPLPGLSDWLWLLPFLQDFFQQPIPETTYDLQGICEPVDPNTGEQPIAEFEVPEAYNIQAIINRLDALPDIFQQHLAWKTPICRGESPQGEWRTVHFISDEPNGAHGGRVSKRFRYRSLGLGSLSDIIDHWAGFSWSAGPVIVKHKDAWWGTPQVWASTGDEGKRVIRHAATEAGIDPDQVGRWEVGGTSHPRYGLPGTMRVNKKGGYWWITARDGPDNRPTVGTAPPDL